VDLHEMFEAFSGLGVKVVDVVIGFDRGAGDRTVYRCACGYQTELLEVMAIHQVRAHGFPAGVAGLGDVGTSESSYVRRHRRSLLQITPEWAPPVVRFFEADDPGGPWSEVPPSGPTKRYVTRNVM
jgi:hypothetical protein